MTVGVAEEKYQTKEEMLESKQPCAQLCNAEAMGAVAGDAKASRTNSTNILPPGAKMIRPSKSLCPECVLKGNFKEMKVDSLIYELHDRDLLGRLGDVREGPKIFSAGLRDTESSNSKEADS